MRAVGRWPRDAAVVSESGETLSYLEADARITRVACALAPSGLRPGDPVHLLMPFSLDGWCALWASWRLGLLATLLDADTTPAALNARVAEFPATLIVCSSERIGECKDLGVRAVTVDTTLDAGPVPPDPGESPDRPGTCLWTSGSTGEPKPVLHVARALLHMGGCSVTYQQACPGFRAAGPGGLHTVGGLRLVVMLALAGSTLVLWPRSARLHPRFTRHFLDDRSVNYVSANPAFYRWLLGAQPGEGRHLPASVRALGTGGAPLSSDLRDACLQRWGITLRSTFGTTEALIVAGEPENQPGFSLAWQDLRLSGPEGNRLEVRGPSVLWGTWQPGVGMVPRPPQDWEPTGDLARWTADGSLELIGREGAWFKDVTSQKVGFVEVEDALWASGLVADCAVVALDPEGALALIVPAAAALRDDIVPALVARLGRGRLPEVRFVERIERTPHGKVVRSSVAGLGGSRRG